tara:strand:+ start:1290 stop:2477 length:1188 start_codon:yes stop_codon:yes gene_type:complete
VEYKKIKFLSKFLLLMYLFILCDCRYLYSSNEPIIRVLISRDKHLRIRADNKRPLLLNNKSFPLNNIKGITVKRKNNKTLLFFDQKKEKMFSIDEQKPLIVRSLDKRGIWVNGKRYSGLLKIINSNNQIFVVNILGIEKYLSSVVGSEMPYKWPLEALKAQAIASRTYALKKTGNRIYDIDSTQKDQVYNGLESKTRKTTRAVNKTRSLVILHNNKLINALFHSSSAGMTENSEEVWKNKYPYLVSVKDFDMNNPKLRWKKRFSRNELYNIFPSIGGVNRIQINQISNTGRLKNLRIYGDHGSKEILGTELRKILGLKSTLFRFQFINQDLNKPNINSSSNLKNYLLISGLGAGHGVGMSQWGAKKMAIQGYKSNEIIKYFYKGVKVKPFKNIYK